MSQVAKTKENLAKCMCMKCPSYTFACKMKSMPGNIMAMMSDLAEKKHMEGMYCAFEQSKCIDEEKGCVCGDCPIHKENDLDKGYYCMATGGK
jgi:hypothetical protein